MSDKAASPERFMKVCGLTTSAVSPPNGSLHVRLLPSVFQVAWLGTPGAVEAASTRRSTRAKPMLWGVRSYLGPGLPIPMRIHTGYFLSLPLASSFFSSLGATPGAEGAPVG